MSRVSQVFSVFDSAIAAFAQPFFLDSVGLAKREFGDLVNDDKTNLSKHPDCYTLFHLGEFDHESAVFRFLKAPESLGLASTYKMS